MAAACTIRLVRPDDVPALFLLKWHMALAEGAAHTFRASEADWRRDLFAPAPRFLAIVAEARGTLIGMATLVERYSPAWVRTAARDRRRVRHAAASRTRCRQGLLARA